MERFVDCINRADIDGLAALMTEDYQLRVFDEPAVIGRAIGIEGWRGYATSFPRYVIHVRRTAAVAGTVAVLGHTTGSHLALPDEEEAKLTLIWVADVVDDAVRSWTLIEDTEDNRRRHGLTAK